MFPTNQSPATAFYLTLHMATLVLHLFPMAYVVGGAAVLMVRTLAGAKPADDPLVEHFRQWLPFVLSAAITAGVAPLLFLRILYHYEFYTANLLLASRWMAILPVLIVAFYLLYLVKGDWLWQRPLVVRAGVVVVVLACFAFIGWSWSENHLLSTAGISVWQAHCAAGRMNYLPAELWPRLGIWLGGVFPVMAATVAWPLAQLDDDEETSERTARRLALIAVAGMIVSMACGGWYLGAIEQASRAAVLSAPLRIWQGAIVVGAVLQAAGWILIWRAGQLALLPRTLALAGAVLAVSGTVACREAIRTSRLEMAVPPPQHQGRGRSGRLLAVRGVFRRQRRSDRRLCLSGRALRAARR
jgi:hypothetical protein